MKKYVKYIGLLCLVFLLTGCYRVKTSMKINEDKSMDFEMIYAIDETAFESTGLTSDDDDSETTEETTDEDEDDSSEFDKDDFKKMEELGFKVTDYSEKESTHQWTGVKMTKHYNNIDEVTKETEKEVKLVSGQDSEAYSFDDSQFFSKKDGVYKATLVFDFTSTEKATELEESNPDEETDSLEAIANMLELTYSVTLPEKPISSNATSFSEDGKTLTWKLDYSTKNVVTFEFKDFTNTNAGLLGGFDLKTIGIGIGAVILLLIVVLVLTRKKKDDTVTTAPVAETPQITPVNPIESTNVTPTTTVEPVQPVVTPQATPITPVETTVTPAAPVEITPTVTPVVEQTAPVVENQQTTTGTIPVEPTQPVDQNNSNNING